ASPCHRAGLAGARGGRPPPSPAMALTPTSGAALAVLAVLLAVSSEAMVRLNRRLDGLYQAVGAGIVGMFSLALVAQDGIVTPARAALVWEALALTGLLAN